MRAKNIQRQSIVDTVDRFQRWLSDCAGHDGLRDLVTPARRLSVVIQNQAQTRWPSLIPVVTTRFASTFAAATLMQVECFRYPRNWELPWTLRPFYLRSRWMKLRDREFSTLYGLAWVISLALRDGDTAKVGVGAITVGMTLERILYGRNGGSMVPLFAGTIGNTTVEMAQRLALGTTELFVVAEGASEEAFLEAQELNRRIFEQ